MRYEVQQQVDNIDKALDSWLKRNAKDERNVS